MKILIDANVLIDYLAEREPFFNDAREIISLCYSKKLYGFVAAHSITNGLYILRNMPLEKLKAMFRQILSVLTVIGIDEAKLLAVLNDPDFSDLEDCLQAVCAADYGLDYIVTRDRKDFAGSTVPAIAPPEFLALIND